MAVPTPFFRANTSPSLRWLVLATVATVGTQCHPATPAEQATASATAPDSLTLKTAAAEPLPKFDVESPIMRQLALLPPAERRIAPDAMHRYQQLTRRFWLAQYSTDYLLKRAQTPTGPANVTVFARHLAYIQSHWRVLDKGLSQRPALPPTMTDHLDRMQQVAHYQQAALADLQADCTAQRAPQPNAATLAAQQAVKKLLAPLLREPAHMQVKINVR